MKHIRLLALISLIAFSVLAAGFQIPGLGSSPQRLDRPVVFAVENGFSRLRSEAVRPERAKPVIHNGLIYHLSSRKIMVVFDLSGKKRLEHKLDFAPVAGFVIDDGLIYVGGDDGKFHCLRAVDGEEVWSNDQKVIDFSKPLIYEDLVIFQTGRDLVLALDKKTGEWRWEYQHLRPDSLAIRSLCPPLSADGVIYIGLNSGFVAALNADTGRLLWKTRPFRGEQFTDVNAPLEVDETTVYAVAVSGQLAALSRKTGKVYWRYEGGGMGGLRLDREAGKLYLVTDQAELLCLDKLTGKVVFHAELPAGKHKRFRNLPTRPLMLGPYVVTVARGGKVMALDKDTGELKMTYDYYARTSTPAVGLPDGSGFLVIDNRGVIRMFNLK